MRIVEVKNLKAGYGGRIVVDGIEVSVGRGEFLCIVGPNGAGKTTILRCILGLLKPMGGVVYVDGRDVLSYKPRDLAKRVSAVLTDRVDPGMLRVWEVVALGRYPHVGALSRMGRRDEEIVERCLELVGAKHLRDRIFVELSDGEKQKVLIARALAQEPRVLVLDEPTTFLDLRHRIEILNLLRRLAKEEGISVITTMHDVSMAMRVCDKVLVVKDGRVVAYGVPEDVLTEELIELVYGVPRDLFDSDTGSVEITEKPSSGPTVFVVGGYGTALRICRYLKKLGVRVALGIVLDVDADYRFGRRVADVVLHTESPISISEELLGKAMELMRSSVMVVDSGFAINELYRHNAELLRYAYEEGIPIACRRQRDAVVPCLRFSRLEELGALVSRLLP